MIKSMTGFGRARMTLGDFEISFEIKSVNNRFLDVSVRIPRVYSYMEERIKKLVGARVSRAKADVFVNVERISGTSTKVVSDDGLIASYLEAFSALSEKFGLANDVTVSKIARLPDVFSRQLAEEDEDEMWERVEKVASQALDAYDAMRTTEGETLKKDISMRLENIDGMAKRIASISPSYLEEYRKKLEGRIRDLLTDNSAQADEGRILTEVAILADKLDTQEELTRLDSHIKQFFSIMEKNEPAGRKLDFLVQEINREINTTGSKCQMLEISKLVIEAKAELEKIREQIQNIE